MKEVKLDIQNQNRGQPGGIVVGVTCSASVAQGLRAQILGTDLHTTHEAMLWQCSTYKIEEDWQRSWLSNNLFKQKEEDWQQMLAQDQCSSNKKRKIGNRYQLRTNLPHQKNKTRKIGTDVSSVLIFLSKRKSK